MITGMAAGFAGLFQTPIAATFFAIEILMVGKIEYIALFPAFGFGCLCGQCDISMLVGLEKFSFAVNTDLNVRSVGNLLEGLLPLWQFAFGLVGRIVAQGLAFMKTYMASKLTNRLSPYLTNGTDFRAWVSVFIHLDRYLQVYRQLIP